MQKSHLDLFGNPCVKSESFERLLVINGPQKPSRFPIFASITAFNNGIYLTISEQKVLTVEDTLKRQNHYLMIAATAINNYHPKPITASHLRLDDKQVPGGGGVANIETNESKSSFRGH